MPSGRWRRPTQPNYDGYATLFRLRDSFQKTLNIIHVVEDGRG
jgi:hypothetical protein